MSKRTPNKPEQVDAQKRLQMPLYALNRILDRVEDLRRSAHRMSAEARLSDTEEVLRDLVTLLRDLAYDQAQ